MTLHAYVPRPALEFSPLDRLDLFPGRADFDISMIPPRLVIQLNLFAGQLYMRPFQEYTEVCDILGLAWSSQLDVEVQSDGFIIIEGNLTPNRSPVKFLRLLMTKIRRNCQTIEKTHMGRVLDGSLLDDSDFDVTL